MKIFEVAPSRERLLAKVAQSLRVGGRFAMSIPSEFVGESAHLLTTSAQQFLSTLARLRSELGLSPPIATAEPAERYSLSAWNDALCHAGMTRVTVSVHPYLMSHAEWAAHVGLPVVLMGLLPQASAVQRREFAERLRTECDPTAKSARPWHLLVAWRT